MTMNGSLTGNVQLTYKNNGVYVYKQRRQGLFDT